MGVDQVALNHFKLLVIPSPPPCCHGIVSNSVITPTSLERSGPVLQRVAINLTMDISHRSMANRVQYYENLRSNATLSETVWVKCTCCACG